MYILVKIDDNKIIGSAIHPVSSEYLNERGIDMFEIDDAQFDPSMIGSILRSYELNEPDELNE